MNFEASGIGPHAELLKRALKSFRRSRRLDFGDSSELIQLIFVSSSIDVTSIMVLFPYVISIIFCKLAIAFTTFLSLGHFFASARSALRRSINCRTLFMLCLYCSRLFSSRSLLLLALVAT